MNHLKEMLDAYSLRRGLSVEDILEEANCSELIEYLEGVDNSVHEDTIVNFTDWLFPKCI